MSDLSDDLNLIDQLLREEREGKEGPELTDAERDENVRRHIAEIESSHRRVLPRARIMGAIAESGDRLMRKVLAGASDQPFPSLASRGLLTFSTRAEMMAALRVQVMRKMIRQAIEAELAEPGEPPTSGIVGTPEW
jgi:hypothetical protein